MIRSKTILLFSLSYFISSSLFAAKSKALVLFPDVELIRDVAKETATALQEEFIVKTKTAKLDVSQEDFNKLINEDKPNVLVVFDNPFLRRALEFNERAEKKLPIISLMALSLKEALKGKKDATGVAYETPPFLLLSTFNEILEKRVKSVGVIYRETKFKSYIQEAEQQLNYAKIKLIKIPIKESLESENIEIADIEKAFNLALEKKIESLWIVTDNAIINQKTKGLLTSFSHKFRKPILCGVKKLASKDFNLCSYSISPSEEAIVSQSAAQAFSIIDDRLKAHDINIEYLESVKKYLNIEKLESFGVNVAKEKLGDVKIEF